MVQCRYTWCPRTATADPSNDHTPDNTLLCPVHEGAGGNERVQL